jgi:hypothetical protein
MRRLSGILIILGIVSTIFYSCKKEKTGYSDIPEIEFVSVSSQNIKADEDSLEIVISYKDGDGDLGENNSDEKNLFVTDSRNSVIYKYRVKQLAPDGASIAIKGTLAVVLYSVPLVSGSNAEQVSYSIYVVDRNGNQSNTVTTSSITVNP